jgi:hypothetical protein
MALLFISSVVPDKPKFHNAAFTRSGNNVLYGIADALWQKGFRDIISYRPTPSYPRGKMWFGTEEVSFETGVKVTLLPILNIKIIKNIFEGLNSFFYVLRWAHKHKGEDNKVLVYNIYDPPVSFLYKACRWSHTKLYVVLYDLGVPPKRLGLSKATMLAYMISERSAKKYIPKFDGRIVINESIIRYYSPGKDFLLIDGGINSSVINHLFPVKETESDIYTFVCAGMLWDQNGTKLILEAMKLNKNSKIKVQFAGKGIDVPIIEEAAKQDSRIEYLGMLTMDELFKVYEQADVLMNLRIEEEIDFHFPSKLLEILTTGKCVISTPIAHVKRDYGEFVEVLDNATPEALSDLMNSITCQSKGDLCDRGLRQREFMIQNRNWESRTSEILKYMEL